MTTPILFSGHGAAGDWSDPANWVGGVAPGPTNVAVVENGSTNVVHGALSVNAIMVLDGGYDTFTGSIATAGVGTCQGVMACDGATIVFAPGSTLTDGGVVLAGLDAVGTIDANGTAAHATRLNSVTGDMGEEAPANGTININDATWTIGTSLVVGDNGVGALNVTSGGRVTVGTSFAIGLKAGSSGQATLSSGGVITVTGGAAIGNLGTGTLTIDTGSTFSAQNVMSIASGSTVNLAGGTLAAGVKTGGLSIGSGAHLTGYGTVNIGAGARLNDSGVIEAKGGTLLIGASLTGTGSLLIDANSTAVITGASVLTPAPTFGGADATLSLAHGATVTGNLQGFTIGDQIEMAGIDTAVWNSVTDTLKLSSGMTSVDTLHFAGSYANDVFTIVQSHGIGVISLHTAPA